ncbi:MAG TPA: IPT/TIG domain-containing protein, partial [Actinomycetota bacterium]|nr:IPT/TIG domain-containing protein [Actinomycetota bacterium]
MAAALNAEQPLLTRAAAAPASAPSAPLSVQAVAGNTTATVRWAPPTSTGSSAISSYLITTLPGGVTSTVAGTVTATSVGSLTNGTSYTFTVAATNLAGTGPASLPSNAVTPIGPAGPAVTRLNPNTGGPAGGTVVTVSGIGLTGVTGVRFGSAAAVSWTVQSATSILAIAPPGSVGQAVVQVATSSGATPATPASTFTYTPYDHVFTIMLENQDYAGIIGPSGPPYLNGLASSHGLGTSYSAVTHPSLGNYLGLTSGDDFASAATNDCPPSGSGGCPISAANLAANRLDPAGLSWKAYEESMPSPCSLTDSPDGLYLAHHDPFTYYTNLQGTAECTSHVVNYSALADDLTSASTTPNYAFITPNVNDDMHNGTVAQGDTWLSQNVPLILNSAAFTQQSSLLFIVWDEDSTDSTTGTANHVPALVIPSGPARHIATAVPYTHYSMLKTAETAWGLAPIAAGDAAASPMTDLLTPPPPPTISSFSPTSGPGTGATMVTINGTNLAGTTAVTFGGITATSTGFNAAGTQVTATTAAGSGAVSVTVAAPGGNATAPGSFTFSGPPPPVVTSVSPASGPADGGTTVTINGSNFTGVTAVSFGGAPATGLIENGSGTVIAATSPAGSGTVNVTVTTPAGTSAAVSTDQFAYQSGSSPASISAVGHESSGSSEAGEVTSLSISPSAVGNVLMLAIEDKFTSGPSFMASTVTGGGVTTWNRATSYFTADGIHAQELWWGVVTQAGAATITVTFTRPNAGASTLDSLDEQEFSSSAGASTAWSVDTTGKVDSGSNSASTLLYPTLSPSATQELYWGYLAVNGSLQSGSTSGCTYQFDARDNQVVYCLPVSSAIGPTAPSASPASQPYASIALLVKASSPSGPPVPSVSSVSPASGPAAGGTAVTITGANFTGASSVTFGGAAASFTVGTSTQITATAPAGSGTVAVAVTTPGGTGSKAAAYAYIPAPSVSSVSPASGPAAGGTAVTISGSNLTGATSVTFGGVAAAFT